MNRPKLLPSVLLATIGFVLTTGELSAQSNSANAGTIRGSVLDPSGAAIKGATVQVQNPVSHYNQAVQTDSQGKFEFDNIPYNNYHCSALMTGFETAQRGAP